MSSYRSIFFVVVLLMGTSVVHAQPNMQAARLCVHYGPDPAQPMHGLSPTDAMRELFTHLVQTVPAAHGKDVSLVASAALDGAGAIMSEQRRIVAYHAGFSGAEGHADTLRLSLLIAHALSHHLLGHMPLGDNPSPDTVALLEREADALAAKIVGSAGFSAGETKAALDKLVRSRTRGLGAQEPVQPAPPAQGDSTVTSSDGETESAPIPAFAWPPPKASAFVSLPLNADLKLATLGDAAARLEQALDAAGYGERSFYTVPDGFALTARLEQIAEDGRPLAPPKRWVLSTGFEKFSLKNYLQALFHAAPGRYRLIAFVVTTKPFRQQNEPVSLETAKAWLWEGLNVLPEDVSVSPYTHAHKSTALIYEFSKRSGGDGVVLSDPSDLTGALHLERSSLRAALSP